jgi:teichoic acid transport system ATP-binding protein
MGMSKEEANRRYEHIAEFSGLEKMSPGILSRPMRTYSSGQGARLRFSIAAAKDHDVLMIDEALATGDREFQQRSEARIRELREQAGSVFLVSHSMKSIRDTCDRVIWLHDGLIKRDGPTGEVVDAYEKGA